MLSRTLISLLAVASSVYAGEPGVKDDANCNGISNTFLIADMLSIINGTAANKGFDPALEDPFPMIASTSQEFGQGTAQLCVANDFLFSNTHVFLTDIGKGGLNVVDKCCDLTQDAETGTCSGGTVTLFGDSGLSMILKVESTKNQCGAEIQADSTGAFTIALDIGEGLAKIAEAIGSFINSLGGD